MKGAIFFASKYGSTADYARWIGEAAGIPVYDVDGTEGNPADFDFLVLMSPVIYFHLTIRKWVKRNLAALGDRPLVLVTVSGAPAGERLDSWIADSLPPAIVARARHFALRGRQDPKRLTWFDWTMLKIAGLMNVNRKVAKEEAQGFDFVDRQSIGPAVECIEGMREKADG